MSTARRRSGWWPAGRSATRRHEFGAAFEPGERWEAVWVGEEKRGFLRRTVMAEDTGPITVEQRLAIMSQGEISWLTSTVWVADVDDFPWYRYEITVGFRPPVVWLRHGDTLTCEGVTVETAGFPLPTFGAYPAVVSMPFDEGAVVEMTRLFDTGGIVDEEAALVSTGWDEVEIGGEQQPLWRVDLYAGGQLSASFWMDAVRHLRLSDWKGAMLSPTPVSEVLDGFPQDMVLLAAGTRGSLR
ncbi:MAG TPA: hypothetical protein VHM94_07115 [Acidimicrobiia bacterium]|nr:hypothetical protein [Acidimicrobiia bacterium]